MDIDISKGENMETERMRVRWRKNLHFGIGSTNEGERTEYRVIA